MVQGTGSSVGKTLLVAALCRIFRREGLRVAPFKAVNMSLHAAVTPDGAEIARAQAVQAEAAGVAPTADMNPVLLKPEGDRRCQLVLLGRARGTVSAGEHPGPREELARAILGALGRLREHHDLLVIEGAGSPAEVNLRDRDLANFFVARAAEAPVLLVGDIDRGGVLASLVGTLDLLLPDERGRVAGLVVNKFRGDRALLEPALAFLRERTALPVVGVVPVLRDLRIAEEDSLPEALRGRRGPAPAGHVEIALVRTPFLSNVDDVLPFEGEPGVFVRIVERPEDLAAADLAILGGSKRTAADLAWLRERGFADALGARAARGAAVLGICGGCQMLGRRIEDPDGVESPERSIPGLGLLPLSTGFRREKRTAAVRARVGRATWLAGPELAGREVAGYEIHHGEGVAEPGAARPFEIVSRNGEPARAGDGAVSPDGAVVGTLIHGLLADEALRAALLGRLRARRGLPVPAGRTAPSPRGSEYDRLADAVSAALDLPLLRRIAGLPGPTASGAR